MENAQFRKVMEAFGSMAMGIWAGTAGFTAMLARLCQTGKEHLLSQSLTKLAQEYHLQQVVSSQSAKKLRKATKPR